MDQLELIRTAYAVDRQLGELAAAVTDEDLREWILATQAGWREVTYLVTAHLCGLGTNAGAVRSRRGGRRKTKLAAPLVASEQDGPERGEKKED